MLTYDEALLQAAKDVAQGDHLAQVQVHRQVGQHSAQERQLAVVVVVLTVAFGRERSHL